MNRVERGTTVNKVLMDTSLDTVGSSNAASNACPCTRRFPLPCVIDDKSVE